MNSTMGGVGGYCGREGREHESFRQGKREGLGFWGCGLINRVFLIFMPLLPCLIAMSYVCSLFA